MLFHVHRLRFVLEAKQAVYFPPGKASNVLRGALGTVLESEIFSPKLTGGPSGFRDPPRPFVLRASHLDGARIAPRRCFHFTIHAFNTAPLKAYADAVRTLETCGLGPGRAQVALLRCENTPATINLVAQREGLRRILIRFLTPMELKGGEGLQSTPEFGVLLARIRDRISTLRELYGTGPLQMDFRTFGERAHAMRMVRCEVKSVERERTSSRTGQTHSIGGFTGEAEYEGELGEFAPFLDAAVYTGAGRQTVWGKGEIAWRPIGPA